MQYIARMRYELPTFTSRPSRLTSGLASAISSQLTPAMTAKLTEAGHTVVGFAAMAAKQANDSRLSVNARFEPQVRDLRKTAVGTVKSASAARTRMADTVDPIVDRLVERLPETIADTVAETISEVRKVGRQSVGTVEQRVIEAIEFATAIPATAVRRPAPQPTKAATSVKQSVRKAAKSSAKKGPGTAKATTRRSATATKAPQAATTTAATKATTAARSTRKSPAKRSA